MEPTIRAEARTARPEARQEFGRRILQRLAELHMNQAALSKATGLSKDAISGYCRGRSIPEPGNLKLLAEHLQMPVDELLPMSARAPEPVKASSLQITYLDDREGYARLTVNKVVRISGLAKLLELLEQLGADDDAKPDGNHVSPDRPTVDRKRNR